MPKKSSLERRKKLREEFYDRIRSSDAEPLQIPEALKAMRRIAGMTQSEYARYCGVHPVTIRSIEQGVGNPTVETLNALLAPFNLRLSVCEKKREI